MQNNAYGTVEVPAAPKKTSIKRLLACSAALSLALGFAIAISPGYMYSIAIRKRKGRRDRDD